ncbi:DUF1254 domain-containing protein [Devosia nitrariae]|uniref:DUF1254 domain-containing protein n=1 Tax=Devosia nitrariae TaxID=2071872 RepID=A0ABQ5W602_9HYPH|nr:hypothetical protein [Devosia nitrariae]GLQ55045.1 hypothetical protein GCM10010862_23040 [Devosia nitrariae]
MIRTLLYLLAGVVLGGIIHIIVILVLPLLAEETVWSRVSALGARDGIVVLPAVEAGAPNPLGLDPEIVYGICQVDLADGPAFMTGVMPDAFWSIAVHDRDGKIVYSTTNRDGIGRTLTLGIFNAAQTRLLAQQEIEIEEGLLIVEARTDPLFIVVRLAPAHQAMRQRYEAVLAGVKCGVRE